MSVLTVGPAGQQFTSIAAAVNASTTGDTIDVQAGLYTNDFSTIRHSLILQAVGGEVQMRETSSPPDGKAMITEGAAGISVAINGFDIAGVAVGDNNGAAVRYEGGALSLTDDYFHNNQDGLLGAADLNGSIAVHHSEFASNGDGSGSTHNIYAGDIASLSIDNSYFHDAIVGHEIKSRAATTTVTNSRIFDNQGSASYSVDAPNGGNLVLMNNVIEQGANTQNPAIFAYGEEGSLKPGGGSSISGNTIVNDDPSGRGILNATALAIPFDNDVIWDLTAATLGGPLDVVNPTFLATRPTLDTTPLTFGSTPPPPPPPVHGHHGHHHSEHSEGVQR